MDGGRPRNVPVVACRSCRSCMPLNMALVHMGAADLFACPACGHQEAWRKAVEAVTVPQRTDTWWGAGRVLS